GMLKPGFGSRALTSLTYAVILALLLLALLGTASRSSFIAAAVSFLGICWGVTFMYRRSLSQAAAGILVAAQMLIGLGSILVVVLFPTRFAGLLTADATVSLRQEALTQAVARLVEPHAITGVGYNAYQFVAREQSLVSNFSIQSRAGADNSLLTLWVTSGAIGLMLAGLAFTGAWVCMTHGQGPLVVWTAIGVLVAIFIHSQFVNSALYGHILLGVALLASSLYASKNFPPRYAH
ncbi:MAG: O-antigen ligase family protein, partial [Candidatus Andersenbacteria bacterium]|nr:O-antigen ligase family protein [Candidatus Andersenbacteria bacterium]